MESKDGAWIMYGVSEDDPECLHTVGELASYIEEVGFLPLFRNEIPGFSVEERTRRNTGGVRMRRGILGCGVRS